MKRHLLSVLFVSVMCFAACDIKPHRDLADLVFDAGGAAVMDESDGIPLDDLRAMASQPAKEPLLDVIEETPEPEPQKPIEILAAETEDPLGRNDTVRDYRVDSPEDMTLVAIREEVGYREESYNALLIMNYVSIACCAILALGLAIYLFFCLFTGAIYLVDVLARYLQKHVEMAAEATCVPRRINMHKSRQERALERRLKKERQRLEQEAARDKLKRDNELFPNPSDEALGINESPASVKMKDVSLPWLEGTSEMSSVVDGFGNMTRFRLLSEDKKYLVVCDNPLSPSLKSGLVSLLNGISKIDDFRAWTGHPECSFRFNPSFPDRFFMDFDIMDGYHGSVGFSVIASVDDIMSGGLANFVLQLKPLLGEDYPVLPGMEPRPRKTRKK